MALAPSALYHRAIMRAVMEIRPNTSLQGLSQSSNMAARWYSAGEHSSPLRFVMGCGVIVRRAEGIAPYSKPRAPPLNGEWNTQSQHVGADLVSACTLPVTQWYNAGD